MNKQTIADMEIVGGSVISELSIAASIRHTQK